MSHAIEKAERVDSPFGSSVARAQDRTALVESASQREIQEVQAAMVIAKRFPRDEKAATDRLLNACQRPTLANQALYEYARGGTPITGPSIRLAEAAAQAWGNIQFGVREMEQRDGVSTMEAFAWDIESNTRQVKVFQVKHWRDTRGGGYKLEDQRDVYEQVANQGARRMRACILGVIPGDVIDAAVEQCERTMHTTTDVTPERIKKMVAAFSDEFGVTKKQLEAKIQRRLDTITPAQMISLQKVYRSLKDGMSGPEDWFTAEESSQPDDEPRPTFDGGESE